VRKLMKLANTARKDLGDAEQPGAGQRPAGKIDGQPKAQVLN